MHVGLPGQNTVLYAMVLIGPEHHSPSTHVSLPDNLFHAVLVFSWIITSQWLWNTVVSIFEQKCASAQWSALVPCILSPPLAQPCHCWTRRQSVTCKKLWSVKLKRGHFNVFHCILNCSAIQSKCSHNCFKNLTAVDYNRIIWFHNESKKVEDGWEEQH